MARWQQIGMVSNVTFKTKAGASPEKTDMPVIWDPSQSRRDTQDALPPSASAGSVAHAIGVHHG